MRRTFIGFLFIFSFAISLKARAQNESEIKSGGFTVEFPMFETASKIQLFKDTVHFYEQGNLIIYAFPNSYESFKNNNNADHEKLYNYLAFDRFGQLGLYFPSLHDTAERQWVLKDSLLSTKNMGEKRFQNLLMYDSLINRTILSDSILVEKYMPIHTFKGKSFDTTECYFSAGLKGMPFSLSASIDSSHRWKLCKIRTVYNARYYADLKSNIPKQVWTYELIRENLSGNKQNEIANFFIQAKQYFLDK